MQTCWSWPRGGSWRSSAVSGASLIGRCSASCGGQQRSSSNPVAPSMSHSEPSGNIAAGSQSARQAAARARLHPSGCRLHPNGPAQKPPVRGRHGQQCRSVTARLQAARAPASCGCASVRRRPASRPGSDPPGTQSGERSVAVAGHRQQIHSATARGRDRIGDAGHSAPGQATGDKTRVIGPGVPGRCFDARLA
jgi:hypothetical protein